MNIKCMLDNKQYTVKPIGKEIGSITNRYGRFYLNNGLHEYSVSPKYANTQVLIKIISSYV